MDALPPAVAEALAPRVKRLGYLGEFFKCTAHQPDALLAFINFTDASKGGLPDRLVEVIALTVATKIGNAYERNQHERLSIRLGYGRSWVERVEKLSPESGELAADEAVVQRYVLAALECGGRGAGPAFEQVVDALGSTASIAVMFVVGRYLIHGVVVNTLELAPPAPSIFDDGFDG
jgi:hypothetical protein